MFSIIRFNYFIYPINRLPSFISKTALISELNQSRERNCQSKRSYIKDYDKRIKLDPLDIEYRYDDNKFLPGPSWADEPYIKPTDDEIIELNRLKLENEISQNLYIEVDPKQEPFNQVFEGNDDHGRFTMCETVKDEDGSLWKWVEKLMPRQTLGPINPRSQLIMPISKPSSELSYHVLRTRSRLYPIYRDYVVINRNRKTYWKNRWDHMFNKYNTHILDKLDEIRWENNEETIVITKVNKIRGNIWQFEEDVRKYLKKKYQLEHILTSVNEVASSVKFKGDFIEGLMEFFRQKGF